MFVDMQFGKDEYMNQVKTQFKCQSLNTIKCTEKKNAKKNGVLDLHYLIMYIGSTWIN